MKNKEVDKILIGEHTKFRAMQRGATVSEIFETIRTGKNIEAKSNRQAKAKIFPFNDLWLGKRYDEKRVIVIYVFEDDYIQTVTVKVFFGKWE